MLPVQNVVKCVLVGDGGCGKTTYIRRHITGEFQKEYIATVGAEIHPLVFATSRGLIRFNVWDTAGQERFGLLQDGYFQGADCAILFFDVSSRVTYKNVPVWHGMIARGCGKPGSIPFILVGNKCDVDKKQREVLPKHIKFQRNYNMQYFDVSAKANHNMEKPFLTLSSMYFGEEVEFVAMPGYAPPELKVDKMQMDEYEQELKHAHLMGKNSCLPDEDDDDF